MVKRPTARPRPRTPGRSRRSWRGCAAGCRASCDLALYAEFESWAALGAYQAHPEHKAMMPFILEARTERRLCDYET